MAIVLCVAVSLAWGQQASGQQGGRSAEPSAPVAETPSNHQSPQAGDGRVPRGGAEAVHPGGETQGGHAEATAKHGEGHDEQPMPNEIWWKWANFALLAGALGWLISKNAGPFFRSRSEEIQQGLVLAARTRQEAEARAAAIERQVANLSAEVATLRAHAGEEFAREGERLRAESEAAIRKIQAHAEVEISSAAKRASKELKAYAAQLALDLAEGQIRNRMSPPAQEQLTDRFIAELRQRAGKN